MEIRLASPDLIVAIDDQWFKESGANGFRAATKAYVSRTEDQYAQFPMMIVPIEQVLPPRRAQDYRWFHHDRMVSVLMGIVKGESMPTIPVHVLPNAPTEMPYSVRDGIHRFYASKALGFTHLPVSVLPYFDINNC